MLENKKCLRSIIYNIFFEEMALIVHSPSLRKMRFSTSSSKDFFFADDGLKETDIESKTQSDGVTSLSKNGCGSFEGGNVASVRVEITINPSQKLPDCDNGEWFFEFVFDEKSRKKNPQN